MKKHRGPCGITIIPESRRSVQPGDQFGVLTVVGMPFRAQLTRKCPEHVVVCRCECGVHIVRSTIALHSKACTLGCGCKRREVYSQRFTTHGLSGSRLHRCWCGVKNRCNSESSPAFPYYGGRGIRVCDEWSNSFEAFKDWALANGYEDVLELDRIDVNGDYEPSNCRWATRTQQMQNTRKKRGGTSRFKGVSWCSNANRWRAQIQSGAEHRHIGLYESEEEAAIAYDSVAKEMFGEYAILNNVPQGGV